MIQLLFLLIGSHIAFFQDVDQAERLFDNALTFKNSGKYKEALTDFESLINQYSDSPWASEALLELGTYYLNIEGDKPKAWEAFSQIQSKYPNSPAAPGAFYFKASMLDQKAQSSEELESAVSDLIRILIRYPGNSWMDGSLSLLGTINQRLQHYEASLNAFQRLEFAFPKSPFLAKALYESALVAALSGKTEPAKNTLARLERLDPESDPAQRASQLLVLLDRLERKDQAWQSDSSFYLAAPKRLEDPAELGVDREGNLFVSYDNGFSVFDLAENKPTNATAAKDLVDFANDRNGTLWQVYKNRITDQIHNFSNLVCAGQPLRDIRSAAFDDFNRLFVIDSNLKDVSVFSSEGVFLRSLPVAKPKLVRCFQNQVWILNSDSSSFIRFAANLEQKLPVPSNLSNVTDFCFDDLGNLYVLFDKGVQVAVFLHGTELRTLRNLKNETLPLKQAQAIAVDASGAIYLADRRGGSVFRFQ